MQLLTLARQDRRVDRLRQERVAEAEAAGGLVGDEDAVVDGAAQRLAHLGLGQRGSRAQQRVADVAPRSRGEPQQAPRPLVEARHALQQQVAQAGRQPAVLARRRDELLREERIPFRARDDLARQRRRDPSADERDQVVALERAELEQERRVGAPDAVGEPAHSPRRRMLVRPVRREHEQPAVADVVREVNDEIERRRVRPVHVLEHEQYGRGGGAPCEERERLLEDPQLRARLAQRTERA